MMTYHDVEILGFEDEHGGTYCRECAATKWNTVLIEKCEAGLDDRVTRLPRWMLEDMAAERLEEERQHGHDSSCITCDDCGKVLMEAKLDGALA